MPPHIVLRSCLSSKMVQGDFEYPSVIGISKVDGTTNTIYGTINADAGVGIGLLKGKFENLTNKTIN